MKIRNLINKRMILILLIALLFSTLAFAVPNTLTLQGKLTNVAGASQVGVFNFTFRIYDNTTSGNVLWQLADYNITTDANGVYDVILGNINLSFADQYYLGITVGSDNESVPRINLTTAPYAFRANVSEGLNANNSYKVTGLNVTGGLNVSGDTNINGNINVTGNTVLGSSITNTLQVTSGVSSNLVPSDNSKNLGSPTNFWHLAYIDMLTVNNLTAAASNISGTGFPSFTINANYSGNDAQDVSLIFERGTPVTNAVLFWDSTNKRFDINFPLFIEANQNLTVDTNTLFVDGSIHRVGIGKLNPATQLDVNGGINSSTLNVSGNAYFATQSGNVGVGTTAPNQKLVVVGSVNITGNISLGSSIYLAENQSLYQPVYGTDDDLVLYYPFSENANNITNTTYDRSPFGNDGKLTNMNMGNASWVAGKYGYAMQFDGIDDYVNTGKTWTQLGVTKELTLEAWIKVTSNTPDQMIFGDANGIITFDVQGGNARVFRLLNGVFASSALTANEWHYVAATYSDVGASKSNTMQLYIDGELKSIASQTNNADTPDQIVAVGARAVPDNFFNGTIDEARIYRRILAPEEIRTQYLRGKGAGASGTITADKFRIINTSASKIFEINQTGASISPGGVQRLTIDSSGNVGIGTTSPKATLNVVGDVYHNLSDSSKTFQIVNGSGTSIMYINGSSGSVGFGTTTQLASSFFTVANPTGSTIIRFDSSGTNHTYIDLRVGGVAVGKIGNSNPFFGDGTQDMTLSSTTNTLNLVTNDGTKTMVLSGGNVGIGTTSPKLKLQVGDYGGLVSVISTAIEFAGNLYNSGGWKYLTTAAASMIEHQGGDISFFTVVSGSADAAATVNPAKMIIKNDGNVGIGTTTPASTLTITGNFSATGTKSAVVNTTYGMRKLYAMESPDIRFYDEGISRLNNGIANISLDPIFIETVEPDYQVYLTPKAKTQGIYVAEQTKEYFIVKGYNPNSNIPFSWLISAVRKGYKETRLDLERKEDLEIVATIDEENKVTDIEINKNIVNGSNADVTNLITGNAVSEEGKGNKITINFDDKDEIIKEIEDKTKLDKEKIKKSITFKRKAPQYQVLEEPEIAFLQPQLTRISEVNGSVIVTIG